MSGKSDSCAYGRVGNEKKRRFSKFLETLAVQRYSWTNINSQLRPRPYVHLPRYRTFNILQIFAKFAKRWAATVIQIGECIYWTKTMNVVRQSQQIADSNIFSSGAIIFREMPKFCISP